MPYKDIEIRRAKSREYQAKYREKIKQIKSLQDVKERFCAFCGTSIVDKKTNAKFCSREHKRKYSDAQRNYAKEYAANKEHRRAQGLKHYYKNLAVSREKMRQRQKNNLAFYAASSAKRRAEKNLRTPKWLTEDDYWVMQQAYELATLRTKLFGFVWHVDHVIPLQGKKVSGLHVPNNLQVIPGTENIAKNNKFEVTV